MRPRLLDLFCGAGGAAMGYYRAGFDVVGVDIRPQPRYPFEFYQADALEFLAEHGREFDVIHASPPCQRYSLITRQTNSQNRHPNLLPVVRQMLKETGRHYIIENVPGALMINPYLLCGSSFGLRVRRHRLFETSFLMLVPPCAHHLQSSNPHRIRAPYWPKSNSIVPVYGGGQAGFPVAVCRKAMGIDWMTFEELREAIPPVYTEFIGRQLMEYLKRCDRVA